MSNERKPLLMRVLEAMQEADNYYVSPDQAQVAIAIVRAATLEEAAAMIDTRWAHGVGDHYSAAIRALGEK